MDFNELEKALVDVRKAYRLLYQYQKRVLDLMKFISSYYSLSFNGGWSKYSNFMSTKGRVKLTHWAWDWLNMYFYEFNFGYLQGEETVFAILLQSDTGFFGSNAKGKLDVQNFTPSENSKTRLIFVCGKNIWGDPIELLDKNLGDEEIELVQEDIESSSLWIAKSYNLQYFLNEQETIKKLEGFRKFAKQHGIKFGERKKELL